MSEHWSKSLGHEDESGFEFAKEMLGENQTAAINFDRLQKHPREGYIILEYLLCEESQNVTPYTSHPRWYWNKNASKFLSLWRAACDFHATLYLVNYAKKGTRAEQEVLRIQVLDMDETGITREKTERFTRETFARWFQELNRECLTDREHIIRDIYRQKDRESLGRIELKKGKYRGRSLQWIFRQDRSYLEWLSRTQYPYAQAAAQYLEGQD